MTWSLVSILRTYFCFLFKVVGGLALCRNSVGSECYVSDELITSRAGVRLRVGNTDAEGKASEYETQRPRACFWNLLTAV